MEGKTGLNLGRHMATQTHKILLLDDDEQMLELMLGIAQTVAKPA